MEQEAGKQRLPGLIRKSQAGEGMQQEHEEFLLFLLRLGGGFGEAEQPGGAGEPVVIIAEGPEGFDEPDGGDGHASSGFDNHIIPQGKELRGVEIVGLRLAAVADDGIDPAAGRAEEGDHAVVVPIVDAAQDDGGVFGLNHDFSFLIQAVRSWRKLYAMLS